MESDAPAQIRLLFEYTKFHIGLYASLIAALMGVMKVGNQRVSSDFVPFLKATLLCFVLAGAAGGIIASTISVDYMPLVHQEAIGPFGINVLTADWWAHIEHFAFWVGILASVLGFLIAKNPKQTTSNSSGCERETSGARGEIRT